MNKKSIFLSWLENWSVIKKIDFFPFFDSNQKVVSRSYNLNYNEFIFWINFHQNLEIIRRSKLEKWVVHFRLIDPRPNLKRKYSSYYSNFDRRIISKFWWKLIQKIKLTNESFETNFNHERESKGLEIPFLDIFNTLKLML